MSEFKPLIDSASAQAFEKFFEQLKTSGDSKYTNMREIMDDGYRKLINESANKQFKLFVLEGYRSAMNDLTAAQTANKAQLVLIRHIAVGMALGFKYASYLHEQRELGAIATAGEK